MRFLDLRGCASARERGHLHGSSFAGEIASLVEIRIYLACKIGGFERDELLSLAERHLPILESFDRELYEELEGLAEGSGVSAAKLIVLNHYTDLRDLKPATAEEARADFDGGCTMLWSRCGGTPVFAQTWDMHATAIPYVMLLRVPDAGGGDAFLLSLTGCLGMAGLNRRGLCIGINNLTSTDAQLGVAWSAIVRRALRESSAAEARDVILGAKVGSGHNYLVADRSEVFSIETSGLRRKVIFAGERPSFAHSNHCLDTEIAACSRVPEHSTTYDRQKAMDAQLANAPIADLEDAFRRLQSHEGYPRSICTNMSTPENPHAAATCAGIAMDPSAGRLLIVSGFTHNVAPLAFGFEETP